MRLMPKSGPDVPVVAYSDVRQYMQTGDAVLMVGKGWKSIGIRIVTGCAFSHIGILHVTESGQVLLMHTEPRGSLRDVMSGAARVDGPQVVDFSSYLARYNGTVYWRQLLGPRTPEMLAAIEWQRQQHRFKRYERSWRQLLGAAWRAIGQGKPKDADTFLFCSEYGAHLMSGRPDFEEPGGWGKYHRSGQVVLLKYPNGDPRPPERFDPCSWSAQQARHKIMEAPGYQYLSEKRLTLA